MTNTFFSLHLVLTWILPVGLSTTVPVQTLSGADRPEILPGGLGIAGGLCMPAIGFFQASSRRYTSASS